MQIPEGERIRSGVELCFSHCLIFCIETTTTCLSGFHYLDIDTPFLPPVLDSCPASLQQLLWTLGILCKTSQSQSATGSLESRHMVDMWVAEEQLLGGSSSASMRGFGHQLVSSK